MTTTTEMKIAGIEEAIRVNDLAIVSSEIKLVLGCPCPSEVQDWINTLQARGDSLRADLARLEGQR